MSSSVSQLPHTQIMISNQNSINLQKNQDFSLTGTLLNYLLYVFTLANCFVENIDNCLDNGANIVKVYIKQIGNKWKLIFAANGKGMNKEQLNIAQIISQHNNGDLMGKQGRFGHGYPVSRSKFTDNKGRVTWLSCHSPLNDDEIERKFVTDKFAQCTIDMDESMRVSYLVKELSNEISRRNEDLWNDFAVDNTKTGVVLIYDLEEEKAQEIITNLTHPCIKYNLKFNFMDVYNSKLKNDVFKLYIDDEEIHPLPDWPANITGTTEKYIYDAVINDGVFPDECHANRDTIIGDQNGNRYANYTSHGRNHKKKLKPTEYTQNELKYTIKSKFCRNKDTLMYTLITPLNNIGINVQENIQAISEIMFGDSYQRNGKTLKISKDDTRISGDKKMYCCVNNVRNTIIPVQVTPETDADNNVSINKSEIKRSLMKLEVNKTLYVVKSLINKKELFDEYIQPIVDAAAADAVAATAAATAAAATATAAEEDEVDSDADDSVYSEEEDGEDDEDDDGEDDDGEDEEEEDGEDDDGEDGEDDDGEDGEDDDGEDGEDDDGEDGEDDDGKDGNLAQASPGRHGVVQHASHNGLTLTHALAKLQEMKECELTETEKANTFRSLETVIYKILHSKLDHETAEVLIGTRNRVTRTFENYINDIEDLLMRWWNGSPNIVAGGGDIDTLHRELTSN